MAYCVMQVAALPTGCKTELCHYRQTPPTITAAAAAAAAAVLVGLTDADICPLAHPPLPENNCRVRLPWRGLVTGHVSGEWQMSSTGADDGRAYSHARRLILMR